MPGDMKAKLEKMAETVRTGGKGSVRRKHKAQHKVSAQDDKKLQASLKKLGVAPIGDVDEVNLFLTGGQEVIHFSHPRVQASIQSNTYVVNGPNEVKRVEDLPSAWGQIAPSNIEALKKLVSQMAAANQAGAGAEGAKEEEELPAAENFEAEK